MKAFLLHLNKSPFRTISLVVLTAFLLLNILYAGLGYHQNIDKRVRGTDSVYYFIYLPSLLFDQDVNFKNNLSYIYGEDYPIQFAPSGKPKNHWAIGPALLWAPFYLSSHCISLGLNYFFNLGLPTTGYGGLYYMSIYIANSIYGLLGIVITVMVLLMYFSPMATLLSALALLLTTQLTYYFCSFSTMSHLPSFFITALFIYFWLHRQTHAFTAIAAGLMIVVRWQNVLFIFPLIIESCYKLFLILKHRHWQKLYSWGFVHGRFSLIILLAFAPQMITWNVIYDRFFLIPQGPHFLNFASLELFNVMFHSRHGLFLWHPVLLFGLIGVLLYWKKNKRLAASFLLIFLMQLILNAAVDDWHAMWSFGHRRFISILPIFIFGIAYLIDIVPFKRRLIYFSFILFFSVWNQLFIFQYYNSLIFHDGPLTFTEFVLDKFRLPTVHKAHQLSKDAYTYLQNGDVNTFKRLSKHAYELSPSSYKVFIIYALRSFFFDSYADKTRLFMSWHQDHPDVFVAKLGLADILLSTNNYDAALALFDHQKFDQNSPEYYVYYQLLNQKQIMTKQAFVDHFHDHIQATYLK